jgi:hypothetical protein
MSPPDAPGINDDPMAAAREIYLRELREKRGSPELPRPFARPAPLDIIDDRARVRVRKIRGYKWPGVVVADFTTLKGERRLVVECTVPEVAGALHIFSPEQLEFDREDLA